VHEEGVEGLQEHAHVPALRLRITEGGGRGGEALVVVVVVRMVVLTMTSQMTGMTAHHDDPGLIHLGVGGVLQGGGHEGDRALHHLHAPPPRRPLVRAHTVRRPLKPQAGLGTNARSCLKWVLSSSTHRLKQHALHSSLPLCVRLDLIIRIVSDYHVTHPVLGPHVGDEEPCWRLVSHLARHDTRAGAALDLSPHPSTAMSSSSSADGPLSCGGHVI
jgi:hypothetical protein